VELTLQGQVERAACRIVDALGGKEKGKNKKEYIHQFGKHSFHHLLRVFFFFYQVGTRCPVFPKFPTISLESFCWLYIKKW
jgi:hypothetical protein